MNRKTVRPFVWICLLGASFLLIACTPVMPQAADTTAPASATEAGTVPDATPQLADPASQNCIDQGGNLRIESRGDAGEFGVCYFEDNLQCEEWALLRGECPAGGVKVTGYATAAGRYCAITGGEYTVTDAPGMDADNEGGTCTFANGVVCDVWAYYNGECSANDADGEESEPTAAISDPFAYCADVGTDVMPTAAGSALPDAIVQGMIDQDIVAADAPEAIQQAALWRCMDGDVWVCTVGADLPCGEKADLSETPTAAMEQFCQENSGSDFIPAAVTGRATVYSWNCDGATPTIIEQLFTADAQGYLAEFWYELTPPQ